jgi:hypothetical protein
MKKSKQQNIHKKNEDILKGNFEALMKLLQ